jgi:hypothetical protein
MSTVGEFPAVCAAIKEICGDSNITFRCEIDALEVPEVYEQNFQQGEEAARSLRGISVIDYLDAHEGITSICEKSSTSPEEDTLLLFAVGDEAIREAILNELKYKNALTASALEELLESAFDGQLMGYWKRKHGAR